MSISTALNMNGMKRLICYLKATEGQYVQIPFPTGGRGMCMLSTQKWLLKIFIEADWSRHKGHRKSIFSSIPTGSGYIIFAISRR